MTRLSLSAALLAPFALAAAAPLGAQSADRLDTVVAHMKAVTTMTATFSQTDRAGKTLTGKMLLKRPGHIKFEYAKGIPLLIVGDGKSLTLIDYDVKQVQRWPVNNSPLTALLSPGGDIKKFGKLAAGSSDAAISVEVRDPKRPEFGVITMVFAKQAGAPGGYTLTGWVALDSKKNRTTVRLSNVRFNTPIANSAFTWKDPRPANRK